MTVPSPCTEGGLVGAWGRGDDLHLLRLVLGEDNLSPTVVGAMSEAVHPDDGCFPPPTRRHAFRSPWSGFSHCNTDGGISLPPKEL